MNSKYIIEYETYEMYEYKQKFSFIESIFVNANLSNNSFICKMFLLIRNNKYQYNSYIKKKCIDL